MRALYFLPTSRKCEKSCWLSSPAPSHENTTNCGGFSPGASFLTGDTLGWEPVYEVEPSPISRSTLPGAAGAAAPLGRVPGFPRRAAWRASPGSNSPPLP